MECIKIDYYLGAFGPSIRIDVQSKEMLITLKDIFNSLAKGKLTEYSLNELQTVEMTGLENIILSMFLNRSFAKKKIELEQNEIGNISLLWRNSREGWQEYVDLLVGILDADIPSHQYLSEEGEDDVIITVAYLEKREENNGFAS